MFDNSANRTYTTLHYNTLKHYMAWFSYIDDLLPDGVDALLVSLISISSLQLDLMLVMPGLVR